MRSSTTDNPYYRKAIEALVAGREKKDWSQSQLARQWGKPQSVVAKIEICQRRLDLMEFIELCRLLDINPMPIIKTLHDSLKRAEAVNSPPREKSGSD